MSDFQQGLLLFAVGFPSVFLMLYLVILLGKGLILFVNKYIPYQSETATIDDNQKIKTGTIVAITSAIATLTGGKGKVIRIERIDK